MGSGADFDWHRLSRALAHLLRHAPGRYDVTLDREGWAGVDDVVRGLRATRRWEDVTERTLRTLLDDHDPGRYEIRGNRIRARYGHSVATRPRPRPVTPPAILYHGTTPEAAAEILESGLRPMGRRLVHLSGTVDEAERVARRRTGSPCILEIEARRASEAGVRFFSTGGSVWTSEPVPAGFVRLEDQATSTDLPG